MHFLFSALASVTQIGVLHSVQAIEGLNISEPGMLVLLGTVLLGIGSFGKRKPMQ